jgi:hypothetical protein
MDPLDQPDADDGTQEQLLRERGEQRTNLDRKIEAGNADDFWEYDRDVFEEETFEAVSFTEQVGTKTLAQTAALAAIGKANLSDALEGSALGVNPKLRTDADRIEYLLDREVNDQYLDAKENIQGIALLFQVQASEVGFMPHLINECLRATLLKLSFEKKAQGLDDILSVQLAYKAVSKVLLVLENFGNFYPLILGWKYFTDAVKWSEERNFPRELAPSVGKMLLGKPQRSPITDQMMDTLARDMAADPWSLADVASLVVSRENPLHVRLLIERSRPGDGFTVTERARLKEVRTDPNNHWSARQLISRKFEKGKLKPFEVTDKRGSDFRNISFCPVKLPGSRNIADKVMTLSGREVVFRPTNIGTSIAWIPMNRIASAIPNHGLHLVDELGIPHESYSQELMGFSYESYRQVVYNDLGQPSYHRIADALPFFFEEMEKHGMDVWNQPFRVQLKIAAASVDVILDRDPRGPLGRPVAYVRGQKTCSRWKSGNPKVGRRLNDTGQTDIVGCQPMSADTSPEVSDSDSENT